MKAGSFSPLVLFLALASAVPADITNKNKIFGLPNETSPVKASEFTEVSHAPASFQEHLDLGAEQDTGPFRKFWEILKLHSDSLGGTQSWNLQDTSLAGQDGPDEEAELEGPSLVKELDFIPDIKVNKYELPPLPELTLPELPPPPQVELPEIKLVKYELPPFPEFKPLDFPLLPEIKLPDLKIIKYELPSFPEFNLPQFPEIPHLEFPDINVVKYELPPLPELKPVDLPRLPEIQLPDLNLIKYELPDFPELKVDLPPLLPEFQWPDIKLIKYELPPLTKVKHDWSNLYQKVKAQNSKAEAVEVRKRNDGTSADVVHQGLTGEASEFGTSNIYEDYPASTHLWPSTTYSEDVNRFHWINPMFHVDSPHQLQMTEK